MVKLIDVGQAVSEIKKLIERSENASPRLWPGGRSVTALKFIVGWLEKRPVVDAVPVVHGQWVVDEADSGEPDGYSAFIKFHCPICNESYSLESGEYDWSYGDDIPFKFCHECGTKMDLHYPGLVVGSEREKKLKQFLAENELPTLSNAGEDVLIVDPEGGQV